MKVGIGLPNALRGTPGKVLLDWARRADERGFSTLGTIGRIAFPSYAELPLLAAAATVTERITLMTDIILGPLYNPVLLARSAASVDQLAGGRFQMGAGVGARKDDFDVAGSDFHTRGRRWDEALELIHQIWRGEAPPGSDQPVGPRPTNGTGVPMTFGGSSDGTVARVAKWGVGWTITSGQPLETIAPFRERIQAAWTEAGREGSFRVTALLYFSLGPYAEEGTRKGAGDYYAFTGPYLERVLANVRKTPEAVQSTLRDYQAAGVDEVVFFPSIPEVEQVDLLAEAAELTGG